jgi:hypothetical protein
MSEARTTAIDAAGTHIQQAMEKIETLNRTPQDGVATNGIATVLEDVIRRIEGLGGGDGE